MNNATKTQIQQSLAAELQVNGGIFLSQNELAKEVGVSPGYLSKVLNGEWTERHPAVATWEKLGKRYDLAAHYDTADYLGGYQVLEQVQSQKTIVAFTGEYGFGKSYLFQAYKKKNRQVYIITCRDSMTRRELLEEICEEIGIDALTSQARTEALIKKQLRDKDALLIFDECEGVKAQIFSTIKNLRRLLEQDCGFVIAGKDLYQDFAKKAKRNKAVGALFSRVRLKPFEFQGLTTADVKAIFKAQGFSADAKSVAWIVKNTPDMRTFKPILDELAVMGAKQVSLEVLGQVIG